jgi:hypothetical protein
MSNPHINGSNFLVSIHHQENHSWQGVIQWLDTGEKIHFRSELELMNLIHEAVTRGQSQQERLRTWDDSQQTRAI